MQRKNSALEAPLEPLIMVKREVEGLRWFRPGGASRRTSEGQVDTFRVRDHSKFWALSDELAWNHVSGFGVFVATWPFLFYLHTSKAWQAQQLAEENKELFKTAGRHRMCTRDAANSYPKPFNSPLHTLSYPLDCTINRSIFALFGLLKSYEIYRNKMKQDRGGILFKMNIWDVLIELHYGQVQQLRRQLQRLEGLKKRVWKPIQNHKDSVGQAFPWLHDIGKCAFENRTKPCKWNFMPWNAAHKMIIHRNDDKW